MIKNIIGTLQICSVCSFIVCFFLLGTSFDEIKKTAGYADFFTNQNEYKRYNVPFDDIDTLLMYGGSYAISDTNELKGIRIWLDDDWEKHVRYTKNEDGYENIVQKNITFPVWFSASSKTAFCSYSIKNEFTAYLQVLFSKNCYFQWWCFIFVVFLVSVLIVVIDGYISQTHKSEIIVLFYWLFGIILVPISFVAIGLIFIIPFNAYNERVLNYADYQPKQIRIDSFDISASYSDTRGSSRFEHYYGTCYSHELQNIKIDVKQNRIINGNGDGGYIKKIMLVWYNPKTKNAFLANNIFPLMSYKDTLKYEFNQSRFLFYCLFLLMIMILNMYFKNKVKPKKENSIKDHFGNYDEFR